MKTITALEYQKTAHLRFAYYHQVVRGYWSDLQQRDFENLQKWALETDYVYKIGEFKSQGLSWMAYWAALQCSNCSKHTNKALKIVRDNTLVPGIHYLCYECVKKEMLDNEFLSKAPSELTSRCPPIKVDVSPSLPNSEKDSTNTQPTQSQGSDSPPPTTTPVPDAKYPVIEIVVDSFPTTDISKTLPLHIYLQKTPLYVEMQFPWL